MESNLNEDDMLKNPGSLITFSFSSSYLYLYIEDQRTPNFQTLYFASMGSSKTSPQKAFFRLSKVWGPYFLSQKTLSKNLAESPFLIHQLQR